MTSFAPSASLPRVVPLDATKHVNYALGMVLGVDDFDQEFAYHSARDRWLARDLIGYGTVWGLDVGTEDVVDDEGNADRRVNVSPGVAVSPCGQLICVTPAQCALLNRWLSANEAAVAARVRSPVAPLTVYLVLCYRDCETDDVPIPGEPCRSEEDLMAPSRLKDHFKLELRFEPPAQPEEDAVVGFVRWLRAVPLTDGPASPLEDFLRELRAAVAETGPAGSPPSLSPPSSPPPGIVFRQPPASLSIPAVAACEYYRAAFRVWTTEFRPLLRAAAIGCDCGCAGDCGCGSATPPRPEENCDDAVLLAELRLPLVHTAEGRVVLADTGLEIREERRPYLLHLRVLQELLTCSLSGLVGASPPPGPAATSVLTASAESVSPGVNAEATFDSLTGNVHFKIPRGQRGVKGDPGDSFIVAAGVFDSAGTETFATSDLAAQPIQISGIEGVYHLTFTGFDPGNRYVIKGTPTTEITSRPHIFEVLPPTQAGEVPPGLGASGVAPDSGIFVRIVDVDGNGTKHGFEVEISDFGQA